MNIKPIQIIKSDERGFIYNCGKSNFIWRKKGTISADHTHADREITYVVMGKIELTIGDEVEILEAPIMYEVEANVYHKVVALTDIALVIDRNE